MDSGKERSRWTQSSTHEAAGSNRALRLDYFSVISLYPGDSARALVQMEALGPVWVWILVQPLPRWLSINYLISFSSQIHKTE